MKGYFYFRLLLCTGVCAFSLVSCAKQQNENEQTASSSLTVSPSELEFTKASSSKTFWIESNTYWVISCSSSWTTLSQSSGSNNSKITVSVSANTSSARSSEIVVGSSDGKISRTIKVTQEGNGTTPDPEPGTLDLTLLGVGKNSWELNSSDYITSYSRSGDSYSVTNNGKTFKFIDNDDDSQFTVTYTWTTNSQGLATKLVIYSLEKYTGYKDEVTETFSFTYSNNRLSKVKTSYTDVETDDGETSKITGSNNAQFSYSNDKLTQITQSWSETEDGDKDSGTTTYVLTYGSTANTYLQFTPNVVKALSWIGYHDYSYDAIIPYCYTGRLGDAPAYFPTKVGTKLTCTYKFDSNKRISNADGEAYTYQNSSSASACVANCSDQNLFHTRTYVRGMRNKLSKIDL